ncbi:MAG: hypothetical protein ACRDJM_01035 [Actinomycetota bacterium]
MRRAGCISFSLAICAGLATSCSVGDGRARRVQAPEIGHDVGGAGGDDAQGYPRRLTPGTYDSPIWGPNAAPDAVQRAQAAAATEDASPRFRGWVGPIYLRPDSTHRNQDEALPSNADADLGCRSDELVPLSEAEAGGSPFAIPTPSFLPPGTFEEKPPSGTSCNGSPVSLTRQMILNEASTAHIGIIRLIGVNVYDFSASDGRVRGGIVNGKDAILIAPLTPEGSGGSAIIIKEEFGLTKVGGDEIPLDVLIRVAEAMDS